jgi:hypothetical protein
MIYLKHRHILCKIFVNEVIGVITERAKKLLQFGGPVQLDAETPSIYLIREVI